MKPSPGTTPSTAGISDGSRTPSRRALVGTGAWAVPAIALSVATPARASSGPKPDALVPTVSETAVNRCGLCQVVGFQVLAAGVPVSPDELITVSLPDGLRFSGAIGGNTRDLRASGGLVYVPSIQAIGSAGTYTITARLGALEASVRLTVNPIGLQTATIVPIGAGTASGTVNFNSSIVSVAAAPNTFAFLTRSDQLFISGPGWGRSAGSPELVDGRVSKFGVYYEPVQKKSYAIWTDGTQVSWKGPGSEAVQMKFLRSGVRVFSVGVSYASRSALTSEGLALSGLLWGVGPSRTTFDFVPGSAGSTLASVYTAYETDIGGGWRGAAAFLKPDGKISRIKAAEAAPETGSDIPMYNPRVLEDTPRQAKIIDMFAGDDSVVVLDSAGDAWVWGEGWASPDRFIKIGSGYAAMANWTRYYKGLACNGALFLGKDGQVYQSFAHRLSSTYIKPQKVRGLEGVTVTRVFASDGNYQALDSKGAVWSWTGNSDWPGGIGTAARFPWEPVADLALTSYHELDGSYSGDTIVQFEGVCTLV